MIPFSSVILVDPPMFSRAIEDRTEIYKLVEAMTPIRRDIWSTREAAIKWMKSRLPFASWDPRVFDIYAVCMLNLPPHLTTPDSISTGVRATASPDTILP